MIPLLPPASPARAPAPDSAAASITIDYPADGSIFPPEITPPTFLWRDANPAARTWRIHITFADGSAPLQAVSHGEAMRLGAIDPRCVSSSNQLPSLTPEQDAAHTWKPDPETWAEIKRHSVERPASVAITGLDAAERPLTQARVALSTSSDPVGALIFYRDVPLMPSEGQKGIVQPLSPSLLYLINWRIRDIGQSESRVVMHDLHTCANCHSFSTDGKTMGIDVDGPNNDKGLYAIVPIRPHMAIRNQDVVSWNADLRVGTARVGFMSQISPDGQYVLSTFAGKDQSIPSTYFVRNFADYRFLQVFYPTRGILACYNRATGRREPLPGASDPRYVQTDGVWSPDESFVVFARAPAKDPNPEGQQPVLEANDPHEAQLQYSLYRVPFNAGKGGKAEAIAGASNNGMSNNFPKVSPDGRWIVFVKNRNGQLMRPDSELYIVPAAGGAARRMHCNTSRMNSWHSFSPNGRWLVFSSKSRSPYTQMFLTHIDGNGEDSPPIYVDNSTAANRAVNIPEFVNVPPAGLQDIDVPATEFYRVIDEALDLMKQGEQSAALTKWQQAVTLQPDDARANEGLGIALGLVGKSADAIPYFRKAAQLDGNFFDAFYDLGMMLVKENRIAEAVDAFQNAVRIRPAFSRGHESLASAYYEQGRFADALAQFRMALDGDPNRVPLLNRAASLLATCPERSVRNAREALALADRARQLTSGQDPAVLDTLSAAYAEKGRYDQAVEIDQQALALATRSGDGALAATLKAHLAKYASHQPLRQPPDPVTF
ncbi:MAG: tetratricopeptide repeat protein [Bryobacteraceae bacterium]